MARVTDRSQRRGDLASNVVLSQMVSVIKGRCIRSAHGPTAVCNYFDDQFRKQSAEHGGVDPPDHWTLSVLSKVICACYVLQRVRNRMHSVPNRSSSDWGCD